MASEAIIQLDKLLQPISEENPVGTDIRDDPSPASLYYTIKDSRNSARAAERSNIFDGDSTEADDQWRKILDLAPKILENNAKDLEVASWYTEALVRRYGFQGLRDGFKLIQGLIDQYWDNLYPLPDEDGIETRVASLTGLNGEGAEGVIIAPIRNIEITQGSDPAPFSFWKYQQALEIEKILDESAKADKASKLGYSNEDVEKAVAESSEEFFVNLRDDISEAIDTFRDIGAKLDEYCGINDSPPTSNIINILTDCLGAVNHIGKHKLPSDEVPQEGDEAGEEGAATGDASGGASQQAGGPVRTRAEAFKKLIEISEFFRKTEPHSPISYILLRAVKWGDMPLNDLIRELIPDASSRDFYGSLTGVKTDDED